MEGCIVPIQYRSLPFLSEYQPPSESRIVLKTNLDTYIKYEVRQDRNQASLFPAAKWIAIPPNRGDCTSHDQPCQTIYIASQLKSWPNRIVLKASRILRPCLSYRPELKSQIPLRPDNHTQEYVS